MNEQEYNEFKDNFYKWKQNEYKMHPLKALFFEVTLRCNARCEHCGSSCGDTIQKDEITKEEIMGVLDDVRARIGTDPKEVMINITGGEPLVRKDLFEIMEYADKLGFPWGMTTNGMLINKEIVKKMRDTHMYSVSVSLDGLKETHEKFRKVPNCYEKILNGLKLMLNEPSIKVVQVTTCVNKKNIKELDELYYLLLGLGIKYWRIIQVDPIGRARDNDDILLDSEGIKNMVRFISEKKLENNMDITYGCGHYLGPIRDRYVRELPYLCYTGFYIGSVLSNGDIFVCPDVKRRPELIQGNIRKDSFVDVWENKFKVFRKMNRTCNEKCKKCEEWKLCGGDAFHTWDFDLNEPLICSKELFKEDYIFMKEDLKRDKLKAKQFEKKKKNNTNKKTSI